MARTALFAALGVVAVAIGGGTAVLRLGRESQPETGHPSLLMSNDIGRVRREALFMYPRGSPVAAAADGLKGLGFQCAPARHLLPNINAPSVQCESAGRGYPKVSRLQVTVIARNGMVSDIAIGNGFDAVRADAETPSPPFVEEAAAEGEGHGGKETKPEGESHGTAEAPKAHGESHADAAASTAEGEGHGTASDSKSQESPAARAETSHAGATSAASHDDSKAHGESAEAAGELVKPRRDGHPPAKPASGAHGASHEEAAEPSAADGGDHAKAAASPGQGKQHAKAAEPSHAERETTAAHDDPKAHGESAEAAAEIVKPHRDAHPPAKAAPEAHGASHEEAAEPPMAADETAADHDDPKAHGEVTEAAGEIMKPRGESRQAAGQASEAHGERPERATAQRDSAGDHGGPKAHGDGPKPAKDAVALRDQSVRVARQAIKALGRTPRGVREALDAYAE